MKNIKSSLTELCRKITTQESNILPNDHKLGSRLVCPEYSHSVQEVKTYPLLQNERIFALCWNIIPSTSTHATTASVHTNTASIHATMCPTPEHFCYQHTFTSGSLTQLHTHDYIELAYVVDGTFHQKILGNDIIFQKGSLCLIDKNCLHQDYLVDEPAVILFLGIANDMFSEIMDENITTQKIISFLQSALLKQKDVQQYLHFKPGSNAEQEIEECLWLLLKELYENNVGSRYICKGLLLRIFRIMSTKYEFSLSKEQRKTMNWIIFEEVSKYIQAHSADVTIQDLVNIFHFQEDYFNRLIKNKTGMTYSAYVQQFRLKQAEKLLVETKMSVEEVAEKVGYHNKGYFYKIFQEKYGMTPAGWRKSQ